MTLLKDGIERMARVNAARDIFAALPGIWTRSWTEERLAPKMACAELRECVAEMERDEAGSRPQLQPTRIMAPHLPLSRSRSDGGEGQRLFLWAKAGKARNDPVHPPQELQAGSLLLFQQHDDEREIGRLLLPRRPLIERLVIFEFLPIADAFFADQQYESVRLRNFVGELLRP